ncbi:hypothetical protein CONCODRAFT_67631 [Conidiobolus coronatus NRRL 28638]|uniref:Uncharacterized protein n=1 Tax=Conidiobolus coronatus (strain ATCC 28846 / CBS 209.66 / NRRL 28638) TaxID=796925 RepID=A0A137PH23_CONC2|nr:hypothetical protein CONCODRAFT_67631 [Conidiobolus coronatus NRRL 28638]|eukprot:KXN74306.1 hypothetical protein CONCODRAFT_67631 [Conidiobolus coronatus NRRL 28638]
MTVDRTYDIVRIGIRSLSGVFTLMALLCDFNFRMGLKRLILTLLKRGEDFNDSLMSTDPNWNFNINAVGAVPNSEDRQSNPNTIESNDTMNSSKPMNQIEL